MLDKGLRPVWCWMRIQAESDRTVEDCCQGSFDSFDTRCEY